MIKEFCTSTVEHIPYALNNGANRIELCSQLSVGGLTPTDEMLAQATKLAPKKVMCMIRHKEGNFQYSHNDLHIMSEQIVNAKKYAIQGFVFGCLTVDNKIDERAMEYLLPFVGDYDVTFHMAFDQIDIDNQKQALKWLSDHGIKRVLSHGGNLQLPINKTIDNLKKIKKIADSYNVILMPGGGITYQNLDNIITELPVEEIHGTKIVPL